MTTLEDIQTGKLIAPKRITLSCGLETFPSELYNFTETLEILDLSGNLLSELPEDMFRFKKLKIAFFSQNKFTIFPKQLAACPSLTMIGFKSNQLVEIPEHSFPKKLQWLILTDNCLLKLPHSIGQCTNLQKFVMSGNCLTELPDEMANCKNLELVRISANQLTRIPTWLFELPRLSWLAYSGNTCSFHPTKNNSLPEVSWNRLEIQEILGEGASGVISKATLDTKQDVAIKIFKGEVTSDGYPEDELATCLATGSHKNLVPLIATITDHPEKKQGVIMELIPSSFTNLGGPPSFDTCTRDVFTETQKFSYSQGVNILNGVLQAISHLHQNGIMHGDLYAHNTLYNQEGQAYFGDFGAATFYDKNSIQAALLERIDVRAFGCLVQDVFFLIKNNYPGKRALWYIYEQCVQEEVSKRPSFEQINHFFEGVVLDSHFE